jgi:hypothetical protein
LTRKLAVLLVVGLFGGFGVAWAEVPTAEDIAACNLEARERLVSDRTSVIAKDEAGAAAARKVRAETVDLSGGLATSSPDAQIHGMDGEGALDAVYRAAYRGCMRRHGF